MTSANAIPLNALERRLCTVRELRRRVAREPGDALVVAVVQEQLPLVYGTAHWLLPDRPELVSNVVVAACQTFALRWRKLKKSTLIATWLLQTTAMLSLRQERRLRSTSPTASPERVAARKMFRRMVRLPTKQLEGVTVRFFLGESATEAAGVLRIRAHRLERRAQRGLKKLSKPLRQHAPAQAPAAVLAAIPTVPPAELRTTIYEEVQPPVTATKTNELVRAARSAWRWHAIRLGLRRTAAAAAMVMVVLCATGAGVLWAAQHGHLFRWFVHIGNRQLLKEMPELAEPARPWPVAREGEGQPIQNAPQTSSQLYGLTNVWQAKLSITPDQWERLQPSRIPTSNLGGGGGPMQLRNPKARRSGLAGVLGIEFNWAEAELQFADKSFAKVGVRYRGNGTYVNSLFGPKQSFKVDLNKLVKGQQLAGVRTLNFVNAIPDVSYMRDALAERLFRDLGVPGPRTAYAYLSLNVPGKFDHQPLGLYVLIENLDADYARDRFGSKDVPIFKPVTTALFKDLGSDWRAYAPIYDLKTKATPAQWDRLIAFARLVTHATDAEFAAQLAEFLDLEEFAGFLAGHVLLSAYDGFLTNGQNFYMYLDPQSHKFGFISWDQDHSWGEFGYIATADRRERASIWQPSTYDHRFLDRVLQVEEFRAIYRRLLERALADLFTLPRLYAQIDELAPIIRPAIAAESDFRLQRFDLATSTNWIAGPRDGVPEGPKAPVHQLKRFIAHRAASVRAQLDGTSKGVVLHRRQRQ